MDDKFVSRIDTGGVMEAATRIREELKKVVVGQETVIDLLLIALLVEGHVLLEGVPGVAKTLTAKSLARLFHVKFSRIQFTPDLMPGDLIGTSIYNQQKGDFEFREGPLFTNIVLTDEINRAPAKTQAALFEVMEEKQITTDGKQYKMEFPFMVLATQNPVEHEGTYRLPEAQLDRFLFRIIIGYPDLEQETTILRNAQEARHKPADKLLTSILSAEELKKLSDTVKEVHADEPILKYIATIVGSTRNHNAIFLGASPRASLALLLAAKGSAVINGRDFITPEDVREMTEHVLNHRIILTPEQEMEGKTPVQILRQIVESVEIPR